MDLRAIQQKPEKLAIGLISGTSVDGVDAALVKIRNHSLLTEFELIEFFTFPYPDGLAQHIMENSLPGHGTVEKICLLNMVLGEIFSEAALSLLAKAGLARDQVDFIGSHGQTVHHLPEEQELFGYRSRATLQIGEPGVIAKRTGILTIADFRPADIAFGGQGAPLVPYFDFIAFRSDTVGRALVNIGGIANITILPRGCAAEDVVAFDTGPGNMVLDALMQQLFGQPYDEAGKIASHGCVSEELLESALQHPYFETRAPKSTGREEFGGDFAAGLLSQAKTLDLKHEDIVTTVAELTVRTIWQAYQRAVAAGGEINEFVVSGGGAENKYLMNRFDQLSKRTRLLKVDELGVPSDAKEAICFAVLANETVHNEPATLPTTTGASRAAVLGKICPA